MGLILRKGKEGILQEENKMDNWKLKIDSIDCPHKIYPTHTIGNSWTKGYCRLLETGSMSVKCHENNCPLRVR